MTERTLVCVKDRVLPEAVVTVEAVAVAIPVALAAMAVPVAVVATAGAILAEVEATTEMLTVYQKLGKNMEISAQGSSETEFHLEGNWYFFAERCYL